jgi:hypothetical protein
MVRESGALVDTSTHKLIVATSALLLCGAVAVTARSAADSVTVVREESENYRSRGRLVELELQRIAPDLGRKTTYTCREVSSDSSIWTRCGPNPFSYSPSAIVRVARTSSFRVSIADSVHGELDRLEFASIAAGTYVLRAGTPRVLEGLDPGVYWPRLHYDGESLDLGPFMVFRTGH